MKDDLISRKKVLDVLNELDLPDVHAALPVSLMLGIVKKALEPVPSVPAVPLDKLCEWLAAEYVTIPCHLCDHFENGKCSVENDMKVTCPSGAGAWRKVLEKGMEG